MSSTPPSYADLGNEASDVLSRGFDVGQVKLQVNTKAQNGFEFKTNVVGAHDGPVSGDFELKRPIPCHGVTFTQKWATDSVLNTTACVEDKFIEGLKATLDVNLQPVTGRNSGKVKTAYKRPHLHTNADLELDAAGQTVRTSLVLAGTPSCGWLGGFSGAYNTAQGRLTTSDFSVDYVGEKFTIHTVCQNSGAEFHSSLYHKVWESLETATKMSWTNGSSTAQLQLGMRYTTRDGATAGIRFDSKGVLGLSYVTKLTSGVEMTMAAECDVKQLNAHRLGFGLNLSFAEE